MGGQMVQVAQVVAGGVGTVAAISGASRQARSMNKLMQQRQSYDARARGVAEYFLGGGKASQLKMPGFSDQFARLDYMAQEQLRGIETEAQKAQRMIADMIPAGGAKLKALAELTRQTQEDKSRVIRELGQRKRDLDVQLTNQYTQQAMGAQYGPSYDQMYATMGQDYRGYGQAAQGIGQSLGALAQMYEDKQKQAQGLEYLPPTQQAPAQAPAQVMRPIEPVEDKDLLRAQESAIF